MQKICHYIGLFVCLPQIAVSLFQLPCECNISKYIKFCLRQCYNFCFNPLCEFSSVPVAYGNFLGWGSHTSHISDNIESLTAGQPGNSPLYEFERWKSNPFFFAHIFTISQVLHCFLKIWFSLHYHFSSAQRTYFSTSCNAGLFCCHSWIYLCPI